MTGYPSAEGDQRVGPGSLLAVVAAVFAACGMAEDDAGLLADSLVQADLRGVHSHGVLRVPEYVKKLRHDGVDPCGRPAVVRDAGAALVVDGRNSIGQIGSAFAMRAAIERARTTGVAAAAVRGSNHCGAMAYYALMAAEAGMIGLATTNALPTMAAWGGLDKIIGINPLGVAIPAHAEAPMVFDGAFSGSAHGKIRVFAQKGLPIPDSWAFDASGSPTTDAAAALDGLLQPVGGFKGIGLALVFGLLSSLLSDAAYGTELGNMVDGPRPGLDGHLFVAFNVAAFTDADRFRRRVDAAIREIHASRRAPGVTRIYAPGELEAETERAYRAAGIPLNAETIRDLEQTAGELGVASVLDRLAGR
ncbi:MAG: Ldh family oxidoreductase [Chloroflexi bacterium]|nr:Ldh family oxidoreductase [Chloroflexota bacterium]